MVARLFRTENGLSVAVALLLLGSACGHTRASIEPPPSPSVTAPAPEGAKEGDVAVRFLADPSAPKPKLLETEEFAPASPRFTALPTFPPEALQAGVLPYTIAARLLIDDTGFVYGVIDSPRMASTVGPYAQAFREAVEGAVRRWSFSAARIDTVGERLSGQAPSDPRPLVSARYVRTFLDFAFQFSVIEGRGVVSLDSSSPVPSPSQ